MNIKSIKIPLLCGAVYFFLIAIVHASELKIPGLFIYFNVPSYGYQNKIISLLAIGWATFFFIAAKTLAKPLIKSIIIIGAIALAMLTFININTDFAVLSAEINPVLFHLETGILFIYWVWLFWSYVKIKWDK